MEFKKKILANGLSRSSARSTKPPIGGGRIFRQDRLTRRDLKINGVSHFLEHMIFKGTEKLSFHRRSTRHSTRPVHNITRLRARKTPSFTRLFCRNTCRSDEALDRADEAALRDEDFNIEKNVIKEEIAMYKDQPNSTCMDRCRKLYFGAASLRQQRLRQRRKALIN